MKSLGKRVIVREVKKDAADAGGLSVVEKKQPTMKGTVVSIGSEVTRVKEGDVVFFSPLYYDDLGDDLLSVEEADIWAVDETTA